MTEQSGVLEHRIHKAAQTVLKLRSERVTKYEHEWQVQDIHMATNCGAHVERQFIIELLKKKGLFVAGDYLEEYFRQNP